MSIRTTSAAVELGRAPKGGHQPRARAVGDVVGVVAHARWLGPPELFSGGGARALRRIVPPAGCA
eukprot:11155796-Lingulodinium_polyedra.AAC.1